MVTLTASGNSVVFTFENSNHYLYGNGEIEVPKDSLILVIDKSDIVTFRKIDGDVFVSFNINDSNFSSKDEIEEFYKENMVGGGGSVDSGTVESMISEATSGKADTSAVTESINAAVSGKADSSAVTESINAAVSGKADSSWVSENYVLSSTIDAINPVGWNNDVTYSVTSTSTDSEIPTAKAVWDAIPASITVDTSFDSGSTNPLANSAITDHLNTVESVIATSLNDLNERKLDASAITSSVTSASTDSEIPSAKAVFDAIPTGGGASYQAGRGIDITNDTISFNLPISAGTGQNSVVFGTDYGSDAFLSAYTPYVSSTNSFAFGSASVTTSENSFATGYLVKVIGGTGTYGNFAQGYMTTASGNRCHSEGLGTSATSDASHSEGYNTTASGNYSHSEGEEVKATNVAEHSQGRYNVSNKSNTTFGDSGNTLFSVGNGTSNSARHNAFEIRQNGDIYCSDGTNDVKLQDYIQFKIAKLTQAEYDALVQGGTVDANTVYFITNSNS